MLAKAPIITCGGLKLPRLIYRLIPSHRIAGAFLDLRPLLKRGALVEIPCGAFNVCLPSEWVCNPPHTLFFEGEDFLRDEIRVLGAALQEVAPDGDGCILDVGGNIGFFSLSMRAFTKLPIVSFEPNPFVHEILRNNLSRNQIAGANSSAVMMGCSDASMEFTLKCGFNSAIENGHNGAMQSWETCKALPLDQLSEMMNKGSVTATIRCVPLDDFVKDDGKVRFMKIDVEGFEHHVLRGAENILRRDRPGLFVELHPRLLPQNGSSTEAVVAHLKERGYETTFYNFTPQRSNGGGWKRLMSRMPSEAPKASTSLEDLIARHGPAEQLHMVAIHR